MNYSAKDYKELGRQVASGKYVQKTHLWISIIIAFLMGGFAGNIFTVAQQTTGVTTSIASGKSNGVMPENNKQQLLDSALEHEEFLRKNPTDGDTWIHLGNIYYDMSEALKSIAAYEKGLMLKPNTIGAIVDCGVMYRLAQQYDKALNNFDRALALDPKHEIALFNKGIVNYFDLGKKDEAMESWKKVLAINPQFKTPTGQLLSAMMKELTN
jgi:tetratricopeptide (TPR) repeat protein